MSVEASKSLLNATKDARALLATLVNKSLLLAETDGNEQTDDENLLSFLCFRANVRNASEVAFVNALFLVVKDKMPSANNMRNCYHFLKMANGTDPKLRAELVEFFAPVFQFENNQVEKNAKANLTPIFISLMCELKVQACMSLLPTDPTAPITIDAINSFQAKFHTHFDEAISRAHDQDDDNDDDDDDDEGDMYWLSLGKFGEVLQNLSMMLDPESDATSEAIAEEIGKINNAHLWETVLECLFIFVKSYHILAFGHPSVSSTEGEYDDTQQHDPVATARSSATTDGIELQLKAAHIRGALLGLGGTVSDWDAVQNGTAWQKYQQTQLKGRAERPSCTSQPNRKVKVNGKAKARANNKHKPQTSPGDSDPSDSDSELDQPSRRPHSKKTKDTKKRRAESVSANNLKNVSRRLARKVRDTGDPLDDALGTNEKDERRAPKFNKSNRDANAKQLKMSSQFSDDVSDDDVDSDSRHMSKQRTQTKSQHHEEGFDSEADGRNHTKKRAKKSKQQRESRERAQDESEDDVSTPRHRKLIPPSPRGNGSSTAASPAPIPALSKTKTPKRVRFTAEEASFVEEGVEKFGVGNWAEIVKNYPFHESRTGGSIKDKYRNMTTTH